MEALAAGVPVIGYRPIPGHGTDGVRLMAELGLSDYAQSAEELIASVGLLAVPGPSRDRRVASGRALFRSSTIAPLVNLGSTVAAG